MPGEVPCPECGSFSHKTTFVRRFETNGQLIDLYEVECRDCGDTWDDEHIIKQS